MVEKTNVESQMAQLQMLEQNLKSLEMQIQSMHLQLVESENSLNELKSYNGKPYKIVGPIMIESDKEGLLKEINERAELLKVRLESMEKHENSMKKQFESIQGELIKHLQKNN